jgi:hypothetical protein
VGQSSSLHARLLTKRVQSKKDRSQQGRAKYPEVSVRATTKNLSVQDGNVEDQKLDGGDEESEVGNDGRNRGSNGGVVDLAALEVVLLQIALGQSDSDLQGELDCT